MYYRYGYMNTDGQEEYFVTDNFFLSEGSSLNVECILRPSMIPDISMIDGIIYMENYPSHGWGAWDAYGEKWDDIEIEGTIMERRPTYPLSNTKHIYQDYLIQTNTGPYILLKAVPRIICAGLEVEVKGMIKRVKKKTDWGELCIVVGEFTNEGNID